MVYDEQLADRVREVLQTAPGVTEKRMCWVTYGITYATALPPK